MVERERRFGAGPKQVAAVAEVDLSCYTSEDDPNASQEGLLVAPGISDADFEAQMRDYLCCAGGSVP